MAEFCNEECKQRGVICDFCIFYKFNGDECGAYVGTGYCEFWDKLKDPEEGCDEFICFNIGDEDNE